MAVDTHVCEFVSLPWRTLVLQLFLQGGARRAHIYYVAEALLLTRLDASTLTHTPPSRAAI